MNLQIANVGIKQDDHGRYCLNDLHRAAGGEKKHQPSDWLRTQQAVELIKEVEIPGNPGIESKQGLGTFVCKELVYAYAMWISPAFHLKVIRTFDAVATNTLPVNPAQMSRMQLLQLAMQAEEERIALEHKVDQLAPRAAIADRIAIAGGLYNLTHAAKVIGVPPRTFNNQLHAMGWIYRMGVKGSWTGSAPKVKAGYLEHKIHSFEHSDGTPDTSPQVFITAKGMHKLASVFNVELPEAA